MKITGQSASGRVRVEFDTSPRPLTDDQQRLVEDTIREEAPPA